MSNELQISGDRARGAIERILVVIPTLNEEAHIGPLLAAVAAQTRSLDAVIVVADGGSSDRTRAIVGDHAQIDRRVHLLDNELKLQSAAINKAVAVHGGGRDTLIRIDAHGEYPADFIEQLVREARTHTADSVVVRMISVGQTCLQTAIAAAQNSVLGNGGSAHRLAGEGKWVEHGHHALMRIEAFHRAGGYDPIFSHNEDAELDIRLARAGGRIWLTGATSMLYFPRRTLSSLFRQYVNYGRGRARTLFKSGIRPRFRQMAMQFVFPVVSLSLLLALVSPWFVLPAVGWALLCLIVGVGVGVGQGSPCALMSGIPAMVMHFAWSGGFWRFQLDRLTGSVKV